MIMNPREYHLLEKYDCVWCDLGIFFASGEGDLVRYQRRTLSCWGSQKGRKEGRESRQQLATR